MLSKLKIVVLGVFLILNSGLLNTAQASWMVGRYKKGNQTRVQFVKKSKIQISKKRRLLKSIPLYLGEDRATTTLYQEIIYSDSALPEKYRRFYADQLVNTRSEPRWENSEVKELVRQGPVSNRINLTIVGDGYTLGEKDKFFADAKRIADDLFQEPTFSSYLPLFNVFAVFVPSKESGLTDVQTVDTALGLYRSPKGSKRGIMPGKTSAIERALRLAPGADYPILVANDDFYGGLGGRYAITTRSLNSGSMVLRHELGHNFGDVGEEYDGGQVYSGANHSRTDDLEWSHWLESGASPQIYRSQYLSGAYLWENLENHPIQIEFRFPEPTSAGAYHFRAKLSSVGWSSPGEVTVLLDGSPVEYRGVFTEDRSFFELKPSSTLAPGKHRLEIREEVHDRDNVLAYVSIYAHEPRYNFSKNKIDGFETFDVDGRSIGFRPSHRGCLMRDMRLKTFCPVDQENMWIRFLRRVSLIDQIEVKANGDSSQYHVRLVAPHLKSLQMRWYRKTGENWEEVIHARDKRKWMASAEEKGAYRIRIQFRTPEVRKYTSRFDAEEEFLIQ